MSFVSSLSRFLFQDTQVYFYFGLKIRRWIHLNDFLALLRQMRRGTNGEPSKCIKPNYLLIVAIHFNSEKSNKFKKFDYESDDDDDLDLEDFFSEFHGNSFNFHGYPPGILKQFREVIEAMTQLEEEPNNQRQTFFENKYKDFRLKTDQDLDGQIYAEQLDTLLKRISPELAAKDSTQYINGNQQIKVKQSDEDKILDIIHGTFKEVVVPVKPRRRPNVQKVPATPHHFGGLPPFDGLNPSSGRGTTWGKTVISIRKGDGTFEKREMERTADGQTKTTITKTGSDGTKSTQTFTGDGQTMVAKPAPPAIESRADRNLVMFNGYSIPCLW